MTSETAKTTTTTRSTGTSASPSGASHTSGGADTTNPTTGASTDTPSTTTDTSTSGTTTEAPTEVVAPTTITDRLAAPQDKDAEKKVGSGPLKGMTMLQAWHIEHNLPPQAPASADQPEWFTTGRADLEKDAIEKGQALDKKAAKEAALAPAAPTK